jgi:hypothetical protein
MMPVERRRHDDAAELAAVSREKTLPNLGERMPFSDTHSPSSGGLSVSRRRLSYG